MVVAIQYYAKDRDRAMKLARWITDIEMAPRSDVIILLVNRFDCPKVDQEVIDYVGRKFPVMTMTTTTKAFGWPEGCNAVAFDIFRKMGEWVDDNLIKRGEPLLLIEPDCVPLKRNWLFALEGVWIAAHATGSLVAGAWRQSGPECGHINGNALFDADIVRLIPGMSDAMNGIRGTAWDAALAPYFEKHWHFTGLISNRWNENTLSDEQIETPWMGTTPPVLVHGCKSDDVWKYAHRKLKL